MCVKIFLSWLKCEVHFFFRCLLILLCFVQFIYIFEVNFFFKRFVFFFCTGNIIVPKYFFCFWCCANMRLKQSFNNKVEFNNRLCGNADGLKSLIYCHVVRLSVISRSHVGWFVIQIACVLFQLINRCKQNVIKFSHRHDTALFYSL